MDREAGFLGSGTGTGTDGQGHGHEVLAEPRRISTLLAG